VQEHIRTALLPVIQKYQEDPKKLRAEVVKLMKVAWKDVYLAGLRAGGMPGAGAGKKGPLVTIVSTDDKWLRGAMQHEMRFLNGFLRQVIEKTYKMALDRRVEMYCNSLSSFYESARVSALPWEVVIHWAGPNNEATCPGCKYLFEHNPYSKANLPTVPRACLTSCVTNCRDRLLIRRVEPKAATAVAQAGLTGKQHIRNLRLIKRQGHL